MPARALRDLRRRGLRPDAPIVVLVGQKPAWAEPHPGLVVISGNASDLDLRPLVSLWCVLVMNQPLYALADAVLSQLAEVKAKPLGMVAHDGAVVMGILNAAPADERLLHRAWELYAAH